MQETGQKNSIPLSDEALALRFQNGDDAAFSELAARYLKADYPAKSLYWDVP